MGRKQSIDRLFKNLFLLVSAFSVVALAAIILFVFVQGSAPFFTATAPTVRLIPDGLREFSVDGVPYRFQDLPRDAKYVELPGREGEHTVSFMRAGETIRFSLEFNLDEDGGAVEFFGLDGGKAESPENLVYQVIYPGTIVGQQFGFIVVLPQPPTRFFGDFLANMEWRPSFNKEYGIWTMVLATLLSTLGAVILGVPLGLLTAVFLAEFIPPRLGRFVRGGIDLLAGIPSVVYGFFGLMMVVPLIKNLSGAASGNGLLAAVIILSIMMLPTVISISETSMRAVPRAYREGSLALGATRMQTAWRIVFPSAKSGIIAAVILGTSRAVGETMAVIMVAGNSPQIPSRLTDGIRTLTATIALEMGYAQGRHNHILFSVGIVLFLMILGLNAAILSLKARMVKDS